LVSSEGYWIVNQTSKMHRFQQQEMHGNGDWSILSWWKHPFFFSDSTSKHQWFAASTFRFRQKCDVKNQDGVMESCPQSLYLRTCGFNGRARFEAGKPLEIQPWGPCPVIDIFTSNQSSVKNKMPHENLGNLWASTPHPGSPTGFFSVIEESSMESSRLTIGLSWSNPQVAFAGEQIHVIHRCWVKWRCSLLCIYIHTRWHFLVHAHMWDSNDAHIYLIKNIYIYVYK
jgi:hypothetical protein